MKSNITVLLGAGFSKSISSEFPTMKELTKIVFENGEVADLMRALDNTLPLFSKKKTEEVNIENWLQVIEESAAYFKDHLQVERRRLLVETVLRVISEHISAISFELNLDDDLLANFEKLFKSRVNILTTNYDLILEIALMQLIEQSRIQLDTPYDLNYGYINMAYQLKQATYLSAGIAGIGRYSSIYKLHGSCDWFVQRNVENEQIYADTSKLKWKAVEQFATQSQDATENMKNLIAGPTSLKRQVINSGQLKPIWNRSYTVLRNTNLLFVFGSSLHETDATLSSLLMEGLPASPQIRIFDPAPDKILERAQSITTNGNVHVVNPDRVSFSQFVEEVEAFSDSAG